METNPENIDHDDTDFVDMDAFWEDQNRKAQSFKLRGRVYTLPPALPLQFELEARKLAKSKKDRDITKLVSILFGTDAYEQMAASGVDIDQFRALLSWTPRRLQGKNITLAEVVAEIAAADAKDEAAPDPS